MSSYCWLLVFCQNWYDVFLCQWQREIRALSYNLDTLTSRWLPFYYTLPAIVGVIEFSTSWMCWACVKNLSILISSCEISVSYAVTIVLIGCVMMFIICTACEHMCVYVYSVQCVCVYVCLCTCVCACVLSVICLKENYLAQ